MTQGQYPTIEQGLGNLSPDLWRRLMRVLEAFESPNRDETSKEDAEAQTIETFPVMLATAKCINPNRYIYSWSAIKLEDLNTVTATDPPKTSEGDNDVYDYAALNLMEVPNTATYAAPGVNMAATTYPSGYTMQAIGGGSCSGTDCIVTLDGNPVVMLFKISGMQTETVARYVFCATNEHDGACSKDYVTLTDGAVTPVPVVEDNMAYIYVKNTDGDLYVMDKDGNEVKVGDIP